MKPAYMLDTNMCIYLIKNQPQKVAARFARCAVGEVVMSAITYAELEYGVAACANPEAEQIKLDALTEDIPVLPFDQMSGRAYGAVRMATREHKKDALDKLIAAHALSVDATLVTNNLKDFEKYPGLKLDNWVVD